MQSRFVCHAVFLIGLVPALSSSAASDGPVGVSFVKDLAPVLRQKCVTCHGPEKQQGGYRVDSFEWLLKPGDSGDAPVVSGHPDDSLLLKLLVAADQDDRMPQKDDPLPAEYIERFRQWIADGASFDGSSHKQSLADLLPSPAHPLPPERYPHAVPVLSLALLAEGRQFAIGGYHEVLVRELDSGQLLQRLTNLPERIHALVPGKGGRRLFYAGGSPGRSGEAGWLDLDAGLQPTGRQVLARSTDVFLALALSADDRQLAVGGADKLIRLTEVESGREMRQLPQHADWVMGLAFNADGSRLASASRDGTARIFDPASGEMISAFREHEAPVFDVVFVGDGTQAASAGRDGRVRFWATDKADQKSSLGDLGGEIFQLVVAGDNLLAAGADGSVREISVKDRKVIRRWKVEPADPVISLGGGGPGGAWVAGSIGGKAAHAPADENEPSKAFEVWPQ